MRLEIGGAGLGAFGALKRVLDADFVDAGHGFGWVRLEAVPAALGDKAQLSASTHSRGGCSCTVSVRCTVEKPGTCLVPGPAFLRLLEVSRGLGEARLSTGGKKHVTKLTLASGSFESTFSVVDGHGDFPPPPEVPEARAAVPAGALRGLLSRVVHAAAKGDRHNLECVRLEGTPDGIRAVATDGHRLALAECAADGSLFGGGASIPLESARLVLGVLEGAGDAVPVQLAAGGGLNCFSVEAGGATVRVVSRALDAAYPAYKHVVPEKLDSIRLSLASLRAALDRVAVVGSRPVVSAAVARGCFALSYEGDGAVAEYGEELPLAGEGYREVSARLSVAYLTQAVAQLAGEEVELSFGADGYDPVCVRGAGPDDGYLAVIMQVSPDSPVRA